MTKQNELDFIEGILRRSGALLLSVFGAHITSRKKQVHSQIVTDLDVASEELLIAEITQKYPASSIIAEESGFVQKDLDDVWIIDPIDGTSNFANGLPWFGVMVAHMINNEVVASGIYLPVSDEMYLADTGGAYKNGRSFTTIASEDPADVLVAFGTDGSSRSFAVAKKGRLFAAILPHVLNIRSTNSAVDYVYTVEGKMGGLISLEGRIWDIAPIVLLAHNAGCMVTDIEGKTIDIKITKENIERNFTLLLAVKSFHAVFLRLSREVL